MAFKTVIYLTVLLFLITGCTIPPTANSTATLKPASGGPVQIAAAPPEKAQPPLYREWRFNDLDRFTKWKGVLARLDQEGPLPSQLQAQAVRLKNRPVAYRAQAVNRIVNSYNYIREEGDRWSPPSEFFSRGGGDCEDFAIAKYALLRRLGVPEKDMRVTVVYDRYLRNMHAILSVRDNGDELLLDNQIATVKSTTAAYRYRPVFGLGREAWWLYSEAGAA